MKLTNLKRVAELSEILKKIDNAIQEAQSFLNEKKEDSDGSGFATKSRLYSFNISEHSDGSGESIGLTGCGVGMSIIRFTLEQLKKKKSEIEKEIESL